MKVLRRLPAGICLAALAGCATAPGTVRLMSGGEARSYVLVAPPGATVPRPLVIALHGWLGTPGQMADMTGFSAAAAQRGFDVVYPKGDWRAWGIDGTSPRGAADAAFLARVVADVASRTPVDPARISSVGFSNGGFMAQALACSGRVHLAGVAVVSSGLAASAAASCTPDRAVPFLLIQGTGDPIVSVDGVGCGARRILPSAETLAFWGMENGCAGFDKVAAPSAEAGTSVFHETGRHCRGGAAEAFFIDGAGHSWPGSRFSYPAFVAGRSTHAIDATAIILAFLLNRPAPADLSMSTLIPPK